VAATKEPSPQQLVARRRSQPPETLAPETMRWLAALPGDVRPRQLPIEYVRITNAIARAWSDPRMCLMYLEELLMDRRGGRRGFSFEVALEIAGLKDHYETVVHPTQQTVWDLIISHHL
jgi:hypothetical protein